VLIFCSQRQGLVCHLESQVPHLAPLYYSLTECRKRNEPFSELDLNIANGTANAADPEVVRHLAEIATKTDRAVSVTIAYGLGRVTG
jgi:hypothetical protein